MTSAVRDSITTVVIKSIPMSFIMVLSSKQCCFDQQLLGFCSGINNTSPTNQS